MMHVIGMVVIMVVVVMIMRVVMGMAVAVMMAAGQKPRAGDIDQKPERGDRDRLIKGDRNRIEKTGYGFIADQKCNHRQHNGAGISGEIAELAGSECEAGIFGIFAGKG